MCRGYREWNRESRGRSRRGDGEARETGVFHAEDGVAGEQGRGAGSKSGVNAFFRRMLNELEDVWALERVAAGEDEERYLKLGNLIDEIAGLGSAELAGVSEGLGGGAAVLTGEIASLGGFPDGKKGRAIVVERGHCLADVHEMNVAGRPPGRM